MSYEVKPANAFGKFSEGLGKGISEQLPKEVERNRLASGLKKLGEQKGLSPYQQFTGLASVAHEYPGLMQSGSDVLRQEQILNSINERQRQQTPPPPKRLDQSKEGQPYSVTTTEGTYSKLNPYIPPSGEESEYEARKLMSEEPLVYRSLDEARNAINNRIAGNISKSNAQIGAENLKEQIHKKSEDELIKNISTLGANIPGKPLLSLQQKALDAVRKNELTPEAAGVKFGKEAEKISRDFSNINSWGDIGLITKNQKDLISSIKSLQQNARNFGYQKEAADSMIAKNGLTPEFSYASMYPARDYPSLNKELKDLPDLTPKISKTQAGPGLGGVSFSKPSNINSIQKTMEIAPRLAKAMGREASPLSVLYELRKKNYDADAFKKYLVDNQKELNLALDQIDELGKPQPSIFGWLNDWWLKSFSGLE